jgi:hypothetical protein
VVGDEMILQQDSEFLGVVEVVGGENSLQVQHVQLGGSMP